MSLLPDSACPDLPSPEPDEEKSLHSMCSGQAHQACQPPKSTLQAPQNPDQRVNSLFFSTLFLSNKHAFASGPSPCSWWDKIRTGRCDVYMHSDNGNDTRDFPFVLILLRRKVGQQCQIQFLLLQSFGESLLLHTCYLFRYEK